jgi:L-fuconolactonase
MKCIDAHIHFWDLSYGMNSWIFKQPRVELQKNYLPASLAENNFSFVHIEAHDSAVPTLQEIEWLAMVMKRLNIEYRHIAFADITQSPADFAAAIDSIKDHPNVVGIRHILSHNNRSKYNPCINDLSENKNIGDNLHYLAKNGLIFNCQVYPGQLENILPKIKLSGVTTLIDHMFLPIWRDINDQNGRVWSKSIGDIADASNIYLKMSGLDMLQSEDMFKNIVYECLDRFPLERMLYGSNFPVSFTNDYNYWYKFIDSIISAEKDKNMIFYENSFNLFFKS